MSEQPKARMAPIWPWLPWISAPKTGETLIVESERFGVILGRWFEGDAQHEAGWDFWEPGENWATAREMDAAGAKPKRWMPWPGKWTSVPEVEEEPDTSDIPEAGEEFFETARLVLPAGPDCLDGIDNRRKGNKLC